MSVVPDTMRNFIVGQPSESLIPRQVLDTAFQRTLLFNTDPYIYQYASSQGPLPLRKQLARYLSSTGLYPSQISEKHLCISFGNSSGIAMAISSLSKPGDRVVVEDPTYFLIGKILRDAGLDMSTCTVDPHKGLDIDMFESLVSSIKPRLVYLNPIHHNPTGSVMPLSTRERILHLSKEHDFIILSDEPYVMLSFDHSTSSEVFSSLSLTASRLFPDDSFKNLVCFGSFSKILTPGLRCGWMAAHPDVISIISQHGALASGGGPPSFISETIRQIIANNELDMHVSFLRTELRDRATAMCAAVHEGFGDAVTFHYPQGGYFVYVSVVDEDFDSVDFQRFMDNHTDPCIQILASPRCSVTGTCKANSMRLAFSFYSPDEIRDNVRLLADAYHRYRQLR